MPIRPFPLPLRLGVDLCKIDRIYGIINLDRKVRSFVQRILTPREVKYFRLRFDLQHHNKQGPRKLQADYLAGRWACKEAVIKAVKSRKLTFRDIEIWPNEDKELYAIIMDHSPDFERKDYDLEQRSNDEKEQEINAISKEKDFSSEGFVIGKDLTWIVLPHPDTSGRIARLSLTHDGEYAFACALDIDEEGNEAFT